MRQMRVDFTPPAVNFHLLCIEELSDSSLVYIWDSPHDFLPLVAIISLRDLSEIDAPIDDSHQTKRLRLKQSTVVAAKNYQS